MAITKDQLAQLNFGYLNGQDLLQFCPTQLLTSQYEKFPELLQTGCNQAYDEVKGELCNRYDINKELGNANQTLKNKTGAVTIQLAANTFVSRIFFNWNTTIRPVSIDASFNAQLVDAIDISPQVKVGTTLAGEEISPSQHITNLGCVIWINRMFTPATTLYITITGGDVSIDLQAQTNISMPPISVISAINKTADFTITIPANTYIYQIFNELVLDTPLLKIGTTPDGIEIYTQHTISSNFTITLNQYYSTQTVLYFTMSAGALNFRLDVGYNFTLPQIDPQTRNSFLVKILAIFAIRNILGSLASQDKMLISHYEWADLMIIKIKERQVSLNLSTTPLPLRSKIEIVKSSFKTLG